MYVQVEIQTNDLQVGRYALIVSVVTLIDFAGCLQIGQDD